MNAENRSQIDSKKIVIFGAGKIGRSFIGQLFGCGGYKVVFIDVALELINMLNDRGSYRVVIRSEIDNEIIVPNVQAISALDELKVVDAISTASIMAVSVGKNVLEKVIPVIAEGLMKRNIENPDVPLDIILAENMRSAADFVREQLFKNLPSDFPVDKLVGLIETSIGKMVPSIPQAELEKDPLVVFAEPYNTLILDEKGFKSPIPDIKGLAPKSNIEAWVDRKSYIHNFGHAAAAYAGFQFNPTIRYLADALKIPSVEKFTREAMLEGARVLIQKYPDEFSIIDLINHIDDLIYRFKNRALGDTIFRVGCDLSRKLSKNDRILSPILDGIQFNLPVDKMIKTFIYGLHFKASDENGKMFPNDLEFCNALETKGLYYVLQNVCGLDRFANQEAIELIKLGYLEIVLNGFSFNQSA